MKLEPSALKGRPGKTPGLDLESLRTLLTTKLKKSRDYQITSLWRAISTIQITSASLSERITTQSREAIQLDHSKSTNQTILSDKTLIEELQRKVKQLNNENSNLLM